MALMENFRTNLLTALDASKLKHAELGRRANVHPVTISRILCGKLSPSVDVCERLARAAGIRPDTVFLEPNKEFAA
jgi:transcriptional regulator with XRE-family HTH domain